MAADELKPTQPLSPSLPVDHAPDEGRRKPAKSPTDKTNEDASEPKEKKPPDNLIDEYV